MIYTSIVSDLFIITPEVREKMRVYLLLNDTESGHFFSMLVLTHLTKKSSVGDMTILLCPSGAAMRMVALAVRLLRSFALIQPS